MIYVLSRYFTFRLRKSELQKKFKENHEEEVTQFIE